MNDKEIEYLQEFFDESTVSFPSGDTVALSSLFDIPKLVEQLKNVGSTRCCVKGCWNDGRARYPALGWYCAEHLPERGTK